jgi:hypothetical protein
MTPGRSTLRGAPAPPESGGLPTARLTGRGRRRGPRIVDQAEPARSGQGGNLTGWLTTIVAHICLDMIRSRRARPEEPVETQIPESLPDPSELATPDQQALIADSIGPAMLVVLDTFSPPERVAFVLHDIFGVRFEEIAPIIGKTAAASRQLGSRARRRIHGTGHAPSASVSRQRAVVDAFLAASREGHFEALLALLDPDVVLSGDAAAIAAGGPSESTERMTSHGRSLAGHVTPSRPSSTAKPGLSGRQRASPRSSSPHSHRSYGSRS